MIKVTSVCSVLDVRVARFVATAMNLDRDSSTTDECFVTAVQIFHCCGVDGSGKLRVDTLMDKLAPFINNTNKAEYSYLKSLLDPEQSNPEINVTKLTRALNQYRESQKCKVDFDESFNSKSGPMPQDSDSGISADGFQLLEEVQSELREQAHQATRLRGQLEFADRQHEEALAALAAERDSLRAHLNMLREENMTLTHVRHDYEEACDRLCASETALGETRLELESCRKRGKILVEQVSALEMEKLTLQELLTKSKEECHRINEMYSSRQSALREQNESLRCELAAGTARLQDQDDMVQQVMKEKVLLEMELKEMVNRSNQSHLFLARSPEVSYSEDQMLTTLDPLNVDSQFAPENEILDEESFLKVLKEDQGRGTNISLFDEIRLSLSNISRNSVIEVRNIDSSEYILDNSIVTVGTQTDDVDVQNCQNCANMRTPECMRPLHFNDTSTIPEETSYELLNVQTNNEDQESDNNNSGHLKCLECEKLNSYTAKLESELKNCRELRTELDNCEDNLVMLQKLFEEGNDRNKILETSVDSLKAKISILEAVAVNQKDLIASLSRDTCCAESQTNSDVSTVSTQAEIPCVDCEKHKAAPHRGFRRYLWDPLRCLFQLFAVVSFLCAVSALYGAARPAHCPRGAVPWRWLDAQELMDFLLRIEYVADVPM